MEGVAASLKQMVETVAAVQQGAVPGLATWGQKELDEKQRRWESLSKQVRKDSSLSQTCHFQAVWKSVRCLCVLCSYSSSMIM